MRWSKGGEKLKPISTLKMKEKDFQDLLTCSSMIWSRWRATLKNVLDLPFIDRLRGVESKDQKHSIVEIFDKNNWFLFKIRLWGQGRNQLPSLVSWINKCSFDRYFLYLTQLFWKKSSNSQYHSSGTVSVWLLDDHLFPFLLFISGQQE